MILWVERPTGKALDAGEDVVGRFGPSEGLWICVVVADEGHDIGAQGLDTAINAAPDLFVGDEGEEAFDLIELGGTGRREMHMPVRPFGKPVPDRRCFVRGAVVQDAMDIEIARDGRLNLVEKPVELRGAVAGIAFADDLAGRNIEGRKQRGRAVAGVVVTALGGLARPYRRQRLAAVERLDLGLLIDAQDDGMLGWRYIETDHVAYFGHEVGSVESLNVSIRCSCRPKIRQRRCTLETDSPASSPCRANSDAWHPLERSPGFLG